MVTRIDKPRRATLTIKEHSQATAHWFVISETDKNDLCTFEMEAYLVDFGNESYPDTRFVVLISCEGGFPDFLYSPNDGLVGVPYEVAITQALAAYRARRIRG